MMINSVKSFSEIEKHQARHWRSQRAQGARAPSPIQMLPMIKMLQKKLLFFLF